MLTCQASRLRSGFEEHLAKTPQSGAPSVQLLFRLSVLLIGLLGLSLHGDPFSLAGHQPLPALCQLPFELADLSAGLGDLFRLRLLLDTQRFEFGQQLLAAGF